MNGFEKDNENPYRLYRVVSVKKIDRWFFEKHNHRRTHAKIYETVIRPKFGICENTFLDYRHESDELLELFRFHEEPFIKLQLNSSLSLLYTYLNMNHKLDMLFVQIHEVYLLSYSLH